MYLRPFDSTNAFQITYEHTNFFSAETWNRDGFDDIERLISQALNPTAPVVALGKPGEHRGAGRIETADDDWKELLERLVKRSIFILMIPSHHTGTFWEIQLINTGGFLDKTLFVMPPSNNGWYVSRIDNIASIWQETQKACLTIDLRLPDHVKEGMIFRISNGTIMTKPLPISNPIAWTKAIEDLINR
ncbi:hypothetical protein BZM27_25525 [Paraburkholderia steynii]|uniref:TIR domain-containing protein n=1 Tax=Paraburkholderia steynii TaxID=1245441 RepID=A0A4R0XH61_9BURK|nr:hypothetical protein BZM27_25525 [Paraburkholderia steynii]